MSTEHPGTEHPDQAVPPAAPKVPADPGQAPLVLDEEHLLGPSPLGARALQRQARLARKIVPPPGLVTADQIRAHWLSEAAKIAQWAESPLEHQQAQDYRARIETATDTELRTQYAPYAMPIAWHRVSDITGPPSRDVDHGTKILRSSTNSEPTDKT